MKEKTFGGEREKEEEEWENNTEYIYENIFLFNLIIKKN